MYRFWKISNSVVLGLLVLICALGTFYKHISFGWGLGDLLGYFLLYTATLIHFILTIALRKKGTNAHIKLTVIFSLLTVLIVLKGTLLRGHEYPWNGSLFYLPCPTKIKILNQKEEKEILIQMCSMEYHSEFSGTWNGKYLSFPKGDIKIPEELAPYIRRPILYVAIEPPYKSRIVNGEYTRVYEFDSDTLKTNQKYAFEGEVRGVVDSIPVIETYIPKE